MSLTGIIRNGTIVLPPGVALPEGVSVRVIVEEAHPDDVSQDWADEIEKLARPRDWPQDYARNLDHHLAAKHRA